MATKRETFQSTKTMLGVELEPEHGDVKLLHKVLRRFGYLRGGTYEPGKFCRRTESAVRRFQRFHRLTVDGLAGAKTKAALLQPRCGLPDEATSASFVLRGCKYNSAHLTYAFASESGNMLVEEAQRIIRGAFEEWARVSSLHFEEVLPTENPTFQIGWFSGGHGDGDPFDGVGRVIAHAFYPPPCGGPHAGALHFDADETFAATVENGIHLGAVAIHEIGHLLGLAHSDERSAIMFPTYDPEHLTLGNDDILGIQDLYGQPRLRLSATAGGRLNRRGDEQFFAVELPASASIALDGPDDADFDLYIKRGTPPSTDDFDYRAWTSSADERIRITPETPGLYHVMVQSYRGSGDFTIHVELD